MEFKLDQTKQVDDSNQVDEPLILMTLSSFTSPTKDFPVTLPPAGPVSLLEKYRRRMSKKYSPSKRNAGETLRVAFTEKTLNAIKRYGTQHLTKLGLNQPSKKLKNSWNPRSLML